jgi:hypothetical protein
MESLKQILENNDEFRDYYFLVDKVEKHLDDMPDISIECCKSLFEGLSKNILLKLTKKFDSNHVNNMPVETVVNNMLIELSNNLKLDDSFEKEFTIFKKGTIDFVKEIRTIRNTRGDISHGRNYPKLDYSSSIEAKSIVISSDIFLSKMLSYYLLIQKPKVFNYEDYEDFNNSLDDKDYLKLTKTPYSKLLYIDDYTSWENELYNIYPNLE